MFIFGGGAGEREFRFNVNHLKIDSGWGLLKSKIQSFKKYLQSVLQKTYVPILNVYF